MRRRARDKIYLLSRANGDGYVRGLYASQSKRLPWCF